jgi:polyphosphate kinase
VGTGNYNPVTARSYTDISILTSDPEITEGVSEVFNFLTSQSRSPEFRSLLVGPVNFLSETLRLIRAETESARAGKRAGITAKMNALFDKELIEALYEASKAGVTVRLIVRGICALRPGVKGLSDNIQVKSVVGRFLEHSRIFHFENEGKLEDILTAYWNDNVKSRSMRADGNYSRPASAAANDSGAVQAAPEAVSIGPINAQEWLARRAEIPDLPIPVAHGLFPARTPLPETELA